MAAPSDGPDDRITEAHATPAVTEDRHAREVEEADVVTNPDTVIDGTLSGFQLAAVALGACFGALMMSLDISIISTATPSISSDFGNTAQIAWFPAAYTFATCVLTPVAGKLASIFSMKWVYLSFSVIFFAGSVICGAAPTGNVFIAGRAIAGVGAAGVASNGMSILVTIAPDGKKPLFVGFGAAFFGIGLVLAPILGGVLTERLNWRWCFWINLPFMAITISVMLFFFKPIPGQGGSLLQRVRNLDLVGAVIFVPATFMLLLAMYLGGLQDVWGTATIIGLFAGSGVMMIGFVVWESRRGDNAMIPGPVVGRRTIVFTTLFAFCHMGSLTVTGYYLPEWFQAVEGYSPLQSGVRMLPTILTQIIATMVGSALAMRIRYYNPWFFLAPVFMCTANVLYTSFTPFSTPPSHWIGFQVINGIGAGFGMQMTSLAVQLELKNSPDVVPIGIAFVMFLQSLGSTVAQLIAGTIFNTSLREQLVSHAGLNPSQLALLLEGGTKNAREIAAQNFPELLPFILEAYNTAVTRVFFVPVAGATAEFLFAFGIKWNKIEAKKKETQSQPGGQEAAAKPEGSAA
ncbi:MFS general substrate transporter [Thozetella sp. PMI_491]|nr:MFS general substrate transporter [Thozetella sp. PMI_491]